MSINLLKINLLIFVLIQISNIQCKDYIDRHHKYKAYFDCLGDMKESDDDGDIITANDCFEESPRRKWKCCYFEYYKDDKWNKGCMKILKNNKTDLNDLKDFVSKLSSETVFNCKSNYINFSFILIFGFILILI